MATTSSNPDASSVCPMAVGQQQTNNAHLGASACVSNNNQLSTESPLACQLPSGTSPTIQKDNTPTAASGRQEDVSGRAVKSPMRADAAEFTPPARLTQQVAPMTTVATTNGTLTSGGGKLNPDAPEFVPTSVPPSAGGAPAASVQGGAPPATFVPQHQGAPHPQPGVPSQGVPPAISHPDAPPHHHYYPVASMPHHAAASSHPPSSVHQQQMQPSHSHRPPVLMGYPPNRPPVQYHPHHMHATPMPMPTVPGGGPMQGGPQFYHAPPSGHPQYMTSGPPHMYMQGPPQQQQSQYPPQQDNSRNDVQVESTNANAAPATSPTTDEPRASSAAAGHLVSPSSNFTSTASPSTGASVVPRPTSASATAAMLPAAAGDDSSTQQQQPDGASPTSISQQHPTDFQQQRQGSQQHSTMHPPPPQHLGAAPPQYQMPPRHHFRPPPQHMHHPQQQPGSQYIPPYTQGPVSGAPPVHGSSPYYQPATQPPPQGGHYPPPPQHMLPQGARPPTGAASAQGAPPQQYMHHGEVYPSQQPSQSAAPPPVRVMQQHPPPQQQHPSAPYYPPSQQQQQQPSAAAGQTAPASLPAESSPCRSPSTVVPSPPELANSIRRRSYVDSTTGQQQPVATPNALPMYTSPSTHPQPPPPHMPPMSDASGTTRPPAPPTAVHIQGGFGHRGAGPHPYVGRGSPMRPPSAVPSGSTPQSFVGLPPHPTGGPMPVQGGHHHGQHQQRYHPHSHHEGMAPHSGSDPSCVDALGDHQPGRQTVPVPSRGGRGGRGGDRRGWGSNRGGRGGGASGERLGQQSVGGGDGSNRGGQRLRQERGRGGRYPDGGGRGGSGGGVPHGGEGEQQFGRQEGGQAAGGRRFSGEEPVPGATVAGAQPVRPTQQSQRSSTATSSGGLAATKIMFGSVTLSEDLDNGSTDVSGGVGNNVGSGSATGRPSTSATTTAAPSSANGDAGSSPVLAYAAVAARAKSAPGQQRKQDQARQQTSASQTATSAQQTTQRGAKQSKAEKARSAAAAERKEQPTATPSTDTPATVANQTKTPSLPKPQAVPVEGPLPTNAHGVPSIATAAAVAATSTSADQLPSARTTVPTPASARGGKPTFLDKLKEQKPSSSLPQAVPQSSPPSSARDSTTAPTPAKEQAPPATAVVQPTPAATETPTVAVKTQQSGASGHTASRQQGTSAENIPASQQCEGASRGGAGRGRGGRDNTRGSGGQGGSPKVADASVDGFETQRSGRHNRSGPGGRDRNGRGRGGNNQQGGAATVDRSPPPQQGDKKVKSGAAGSQQPLLATAEGATTEAATQPKIVDSTTAVKSGAGAVGSTPSGGSSVGGRAVSSSTSWAARLGGGFASAATPSTASLPVASPRQQSDVKQQANANTSSEAVKVVAKETDKPVVEKESSEKTETTDGVATATGVVTTTPPKEPKAAYVPKAKRDANVVPDAKLESTTTTEAAVKNATVPLTAAAKVAAAAVKEKENAAAAATTAKREVAQPVVGESKPTVPVPAAAVAAVVEKQKTVVVASATHTVTDAAPVDGSYAAAASGKRSFRDIMTAGPGAPSTEKTASSSAGANLSQALAKGQSAKEPEAAVAPVPTVAAPESKGIAHSATASASRRPAGAARVEESDLLIVQQPSKSELQHSDTVDMAEEISDDEEESGEVPTTMPRPRQASTTSAITVTSTATDKKTVEPPVGEQTQQQVVSHVVEVKEQTTDTPVALTVVEKPQTPEQECDERREWLQNMWSSSATIKKPTPTVPAVVSPVVPVAAATVIDSGNNVFVADVKKENVVVDVCVTEEEGRTTGDTSPSDDQIAVVKEPVMDTQTKDNDVVEKEVEAEAEPEPVKDDAAAAKAEVSLLNEDQSGVVGVTSVTVTDTDKTKLEAPESQQESGSATGTPVTKSPAITALPRVSPRVSISRDSPSEQSGSMSIARLPPASAMSLRSSPPTAIAARRDFGDSSTPLIPSIAVAVERLSTPTSAIGGESFLGSSSAIAAATGERPITHSPALSSTECSGGAATPRTYTLQDMIAFRLLDKSQNPPQGSIPDQFKGDGVVSRGRRGGGVDHWRGQQGGRDPWRSGGGYGDRRDDRMKDGMRGSRRTMGPEGMGGMPLRRDGRDDGRRGDGRGGEQYRGSGGGGRDRDFEPNMSWRTESRPQLKLDTTDDSWLVQQQLAKAKKGSTELVLRKLRALLNKLTLDNFDRLYAGLRAGDTGMSTYDELEQLVRLIFEKATMQHHYIAMYCDFCKRLNDDIGQFNIVDSNGEVPDFRRLLVNVCQDLFEKNTTVPEPEEDSTEEEKFEFLLKFKKTVKGNMIFIGELAKSGMLAWKVIIACLEQLLGKTSEHDVEGLCVLLDTVGQHLLAKSQKRSVVIYRGVDAKSEDKDLPFRLRCLLKDCVDNYKNWSQGRSAKGADDGPMTIAQVHQRASMGIPQSSSQISLGSHDTLADVGSYQASFRSGSALQHAGTMPPQFERDDGFQTVSSRKQRPTVARPTFTTGRIGEGVTGFSRVNSGMGLNSPTRSLSRNVGSNTFSVFSKGATKKGGTEKRSSKKGGEDGPGLRSSASRSDLKPSASDDSLSEAAHDVGMQQSVSIAGLTASSTPSTGSADIGSLPEGERKSKYLEEVKKIQKELLESQAVPEATECVKQLNITPSDQRHVLRKMVNNIFDMDRRKRDVCLKWVLQWASETVMENAEFTQGILDYIQLDFKESVIDQPNLQEIVKEEFMTPGQEVAAGVFTTNFICEMDERIAAALVEEDFDDTCFDPEEGGPQPPQTALHSALANGNNGPVPETTVAS